jgi:hypothetical protein
MRPATRASTACLLALSACGLERPARPQEAPVRTGLQPDVARSEYSTRRLIEQSIDLAARGCRLAAPRRCCGRH